MVGIFKGIMLFVIWFIMVIVIEVFLVEEFVYFFLIKVSVIFKFKIIKIIFV